MHSIRTLLQIKGRSSKIIVKGYEKEISLKTYKQFLTRNYGHKFDAAILKRGSFEYLDKDFGEYVDFDDDTMIVDMTKLRIIPDSGPSSSTSDGSTDGSVDAEVTTDDSPCDENSDESVARINGNTYNSELISANETCLDTVTPSYSLSPKEFLIEAVKKWYEEFVRDKTEYKERAWQLVQRDVKLYNTHNRIATLCSIEYLERQLRRLVEMYESLLIRSSNVTEAVSEWPKFQDFHYDIDLGVFLTASEFLKVIRLRKLFSARNKCDRKPKHMSTQSVLHIHNLNLSVNLLTAAERLAKNFSVGQYYKDRISGEKYDVREHFVKLLYQYMVCLNCFSDEEEADLSWSFFHKFHSELDLKSINLDNEIRCSMADAMRQFNMNISDAEREDTD